MAHEHINIANEMYLWAIERAGYKQDEFLQTHPDVSAYLQGKKQPTIKQLETFANTVHVPVAYLMLPTPPIETSPIPMFRGKAGKGKFDLNVYQTVLDVQGRQEWLSDYLSENELDECQFVGKYDIHTPVTDMAEIIRQHLDLETDWMIDFKNPDSAINFFVEKMENAGICVFFNGIVGNNTHRPLDVEECRGFALAGETNAPMIFVNNSDSKNAQLFTLAHEFTHVLVGVSAGYGGFEGEYHDAIESYCDKVAAEFLVPEGLLRIYWADSAAQEKGYWTIIEECSKAFNISKLVIARRAHNLGMLNSENYREFYLRYRSASLSNKKRSSGGAFYRTAVKRVGRLFAIHIYNAVRSRQLSYTEAYRLTGLYGKTFDKFMTTSI